MTGANPGEAQPPAQSAPQPGAQPGAQPPAQPGARPGAVAGTRPGPPNRPPAGLVEEALASARAGTLPMADFLRLLLRAELAVPSAGEVLPDGSGFRPLLFPKGAASMVACFTARDRIGAFAAKAPYCLMIKGEAFLKHIPPGHGLVVNPGQELGLEIDPAGLARVLALAPYAHAPLAPAP